MIFEIDLRILRALRMLRLLKFSRYFKVMNLLLGVLKEERQSFLAPMFLLTIAMLIASTGIYIFEKKTPNPISLGQYLRRCGGP